MIENHSLVFNHINANAQMVFWKNLRLLNESKLNLIDLDVFKKPINYLTFLFVNYVRRKKKVVRGTSIWVLDEWTINYYHWMMEAIPKILSTRLPFHESVVLLPSRYKEHSFHEESLKLLNIRYDFFDSVAERVECEALYVPLGVSLRGIANPVYVEKMRRLFKEALSCGNEVGNRRIYVSRRLAKKRKVSNEVELIQMLSQFRFETVDFETLSFRDQVKLSTQCECMIGLHGAGLTNMFFMAPGAKVIELARENENNFCYKNLAFAASLHFKSLTCAQLDENIHHSDFTVDMAALELLIREFLC